MYNYIDYIKQIYSLMESVKSFENISPLLIDEAFNKALDIFLYISKLNKNVIFFGNGASASIASHFTADFFKNAKLNAFNLENNSLLTAISNDNAFEDSFSTYMNFLKKDDLIVCISSSGKSPNIINALKEAKKREIKTILFFGFSVDSKILSLSDISFFVNSTNYGEIESIHATMIHYLLDLFLLKKNIA